jgi:hypothetical protein
MIADHARLALENSTNNTALYTLQHDYDALIREHREVKQHNDSNKKLVSEHKSLYELEKTLHNQCKTTNIKLIAECKESDICLNTLEKRYCVIEKQNETLTNKLADTTREFNELTQKLKEVHSYYNTAQILLTNTVKQSQVQMIAYNQLHNDLSKIMNETIEFIHTEDKSIKTPQVFETLHTQFNTLASQLQNAEHTFHSTAVSIDDHDRLTAYHEALKTYITYMQNIATNTVTNNNTLQKENIGLQNDLARLDMESKAYVERLIQVCCDFCCCLLQNTVLELFLVWRE